jgi:hypothetical protein
MLLFVAPVWLLWLSITWRRTVGTAPPLRFSLCALITIACLALGLALDSYIVASKLSDLDTAQSIAAMHRASRRASILLGSSLVLAVGFTVVALAARQRR